MPFQWDKSPEQAFVPGYAAYERQIRWEIRRIAERFAPQIEEWMRQNHPWENVTGQAEAGLHTEIEEVVGQMISVILDHGVEYGVWLEFAHGGKWGIVADAMDYWSAQLWEAVKALFV
jgi:hypothetical protein